MGAAPRATARPRGTQPADPEVVHAPPFQEEVALLREQQVEACEVHLLLVDLDLCEVGVHGEVQRQVLRDGVLDVQACVRQPIILDSGSHDPIGADPRGRKRLHLEVQPRRRRLDADQIPVHRYAEDRIRPGPRHLDRYRGEVAPLIAAQHGATDLNAPDLLDAWAIAERLEGNRHLNRPPAVEPTRGHIPDRVPVEIGGRLIGDLHFREAADRVHEEADGVAAVAVGVEVDPERVVGAELGRIAAHLVRNPPRLAERIPHAGGDVQVRVVESNPDLRALRWYASRDGDGLDQVVKRRRRFVEGFAQAAIHDDSFADTVGANRRIPLRVPGDCTGGGRDRLSEGTAGQEQAEGERSGRKSMGGDPPASMHDSPAATVPHERVAHHDTLPRDQNRRKRFTFTTSDRFCRPGAPGAASLSRSSFSTMKSSLPGRTPIAGARWSRSSVCSSCTGAARWQTGAA